MAEFYGILNIVAYILVGILKFLGTLVFGLGLGWFALDTYKKSPQPWQTQVAFAVAVSALLIASLRFSHLALAGLTLGLGLAVLIWGLPRKKKDQAG